MDDAPATLPIREDARENVVKTTGAADGSAFG